MNRFPSRKNPSQMRISRCPHWRPRTCRPGAWFLFSSLCLATVRATEAQTLDAQLESLASEYREVADPKSQERLLAFCRRNAKGPQGALGFLLLGYQALENGKFEEALKHLKLASRADAPVADYAAYYAASAAFELKEFKECQSALAGFPARFPSSPLLMKARLLHWRSSLELKDGQAVLDSIAGVAELDSNPDALYYEAQAHELLGNAPKAVSTYRKLHYQFPLYASAAAVARNLIALGSGDANIPTSWRVARIEKLLGGRKHREALAEIQLLFGTDSEAANQPQYQLWLGLSQFGTAQYYAAIQTLKPLRNAPVEIAAQAWFTVAECYRKLDNYGQFKQTAVDMEAGFARSRWLEEALFSLGNYNLVRRDLGESMAFYRKLVERFPNGARAKDSHWRVAWHTYRAGSMESALELFVDHLSRFPDSEHRAAALYWAGRAQLRLGRPEEARPVFEAVAQRFPAQYYGQLARAQLAPARSPARVSYRPDSRIEKILADLKRAAPASPDLAPLLNASLNGWPRAKALSQIGLFELAGKELQYRPAYGSSRSIDFQAAQLFVKAKNFHRSTTVLRRVFPDYLDLPFGALPREVWQMFYPANYEDIIQQEAAKYAIDPYLIMALIRQESAFNPKAISSANARGLMQLLPSTARRLARGMKLARPSQARLHDPALNIRLGMRYFSDLLKQFNGETGKALASYNAGEHRVEAWMSEGSYADSAEFVDTIPFSETRNYVKIINRNYFFYRSLYGETRR
jgi:soluble lytic murein transglycosylase